MSAPQDDNNDTPRQPRLNFFFNDICEGLVHNDKKDSVVIHTANRESVAQLVEDEPYLENEELMNEVKSILRTVLTEEKRKEWMAGMKEAGLYFDRFKNDTPNYSQKEWTNLIVAFRDKWGNEKVPSNLKRHLILVGSKQMEDDYKLNHMFDDVNYAMRTRGFL